MNNEQEKLSQNDERVCQILGSLEKIDAPKDFHFQLKSKIAVKKSARQNSTGWRTLLIGIPGLACILLAAFFAFNRNFPTPIATVKPPETETAAVPEIINTLPNSNIEVVQATKPELPVFTKGSSAIEPKSAHNRVIAKAEKPQNEALADKKILPKDSTVKDDFVGVRTPAATDINKPLVQKGLNGSAVNTGNTKINETDTVFEIESLLNDLGIETTAENGKLKVKAVRKNSSAERSGVRNADVIEAVDNKKISPKDTLKKSFDAKSINVTREGKAIELILKH